VASYPWIMGRIDLLCNLLLQIEMLNTLCFVVNEKYLTSYLERSVSILVSPVIVNEVYDLILTVDDMGTWVPVSDPNLSPILSQSKSSHPQQPPTLYENITKSLLILYLLSD
jgi:hypothetical protein